MTLGVDGLKSVTLRVEIVESADTGYLPCQ